MPKHLWVKYFLAATVVIVIALFAYHNRPYDFKTPTTEQLAKAFPGQSRDILENSQQFTLYSLDASNVPQEKETFRGWGVLGKTEVSDPKVRRLLIRSLYDSIARGGWQASCFVPHHAIHAVRAGESVDVIICFHCGQVAVVSGGQDATATITHDPPPAFDQVLTQAGIPLGRR
ncbi:MAG: hypothetical protein M3Y28_08005 [Armatimonadota bacterium]|nr:hypothetical protein [Armatimonadota bacterium]